MRKINKGLFMAMSLAMAATAYNAYGVNLDSVNAAVDSVITDDDSEALDAVVEFSDPDATYTYTGSEIKPDVTVTTNSGEDIDSEYYTVSYSNNINAGTATITVTFNDSLFDEKTLNFTISPADPDVTFPDDMDIKCYATLRKAITAEPNLLPDGFGFTSLDKELTVGVANKVGVVYNKKDSNYNILIGEINVTPKHSIVKVEAKEPSIDGVGNTEFYKCEYCDTYYEDAEGTKEITDKDSVYYGEQKIAVKSVVLDGSTNGYVYTGEAITPQVTVFDKDGYRIEASEENYTLTYSNNVNAGKATVTVSFLGDYLTNPDVVLEFIIEKADFKYKSLTLSDTSFVYSGKEAKPSVTLIDASGNKVDSSNYTVSYKNNKAVGLATVTLSAPNYKSIVKTFKILPRASKVTSVSCSSTSGVTVKWSKVSEAAGYYIYRSANGGKYKLIKTLTKNTITSYVDKAAKANGGKYAYKVVAFKNVSGNTYKSAASVGKYSYCIAKPVIKSAANTAAGKITVKWAKNSKATGYQIQIGTGTAKKVINVNGANSVSKVISSLKKGSTYRVYVRAFKTVGKVKYYSDWTSKTVKIAK